MQPPNPIIMDETPFPPLPKLFLKQAKQSIDKTQQMGRVRKGKEHQSITEVPFVLHSNLIFHQSKRTAKRTKLKGAVGGEGRRKKNQRNHQHFDILCIKLLKRFYAPPTFHHERITYYTKVSLPSSHSCFLDCQRSASSSTTGQLLHLWLFSQLLLFRATSCEQQASHSFSRISN